jgi:ATP-dependent protease HslVU (ClpYQ) peptidase subunit
VTCIVGIAHAGRVVIGGDSVGSNGYNAIDRADGKVFQNGAFVFGFTTSYRMGQLLRYAFNPPTPRQGQDVMAFMVNDFIDAVRACLKAGGFAATHDQVEKGGVFLVGYAGRLFRIEADYQVGESARGYDAVGCGEAYALGALHAMGNHVEPLARVERALAAAEQHSAHVRRPFVTVASTEG